MVRRRLAIGSAALAVAVVAAITGGLTISVDRNGGQHAASGREALPDLPEDGWWLVLHVNTGTAPDGNDRAVAEELAGQARAAGYQEAAVYPNPGSPHLCWGEPCQGLGVPPGDGHAVVLRRLDGPDFREPEPYLNARLEFDADVRQPALAETASKGLPPASVHWLPFSTLEQASAWRTWDPAPPLAEPLWKRLGCLNAAQPIPRAALVGLPLSEVEARAAAEDLLVRVLGQDGDCNDRTDDRRQDRVNVYLLRGEVAWAAQF